jgi:DtxR family Mn-dependent transcriptional regulator
MEDYLEAISVLRDRQPFVRISHIGQALGVSTPSVTAAVKKLSEEGLVDHEPYGHVDLTARGMQIAEDVFRRHEALRRFLEEILGVEPEAAAADACRMEHEISGQTRDRLSKFVEFVLGNPKGAPEWIDHFNEYFEHGELPETCRSRCYAHEITTTDARLAGIEQGEPV